MGRELCLFLAVDASQIPAKQRTAFVDLAVRRAAPFGDPEHDVLWLDDHAAVWFWSRSRVRALAGALRPGSVRFRAEALFRGQAHGDSQIELLSYAVPAESTEAAATAGIEARVWKEGRLTASRWWPGAPDAASWQVFARGVGLAAGTAPPPLPADLRRVPLTSSRLSRRPAEGLGDLRRVLPVVAATTAVAVVALLAWQAAGLARLGLESRRLEQRIARVSGRLQPVITARETADRALAEVNSLLALRGVPSQTRLLAEVARAIPGTWQMTLWHTPSPGVLEITLRIQQPDVPTIVGALENSPLLQDVSPQSAGKDELKLQAHLTPLAGGAK